MPSLVLLLLLMLELIIVRRAGGMHTHANQETISRDGVRRGLETIDLDISGVVQEAFDAEGVSLGYRDDDESDWTFSQVDFGTLTTTTTFMYHQNASYYIVGESGTVVEFWHPYDADLGGGDMAAIHLSIAADFVLSGRNDGEDTVRVKVVNAGWGRVREAKMECKDLGGDGCPTLVLAETTNMVNRFANKDAAVLDGFITDWALVEGWMITDDFIKYYAYDFSIGGKWIGVPLVSDMRVLAYNKTTFETFDISEPPGVDSSESWEWEDFVDAAEQLTLATGEPGWYFGGGFDEEMKLSLMISRNWGSTLYREDAENSAEYACALDGNFVKAMNSTIKLMLREGWMSTQFITDMHTDMGDTINVTEVSSLDRGEGDHNRGGTSGDPYRHGQASGCLNTVLSVNSTEMLGMAILSPKALLDCSGDDIGIAFVPGRYGYLGGTGLFVGENSTLEQQSHAWHLAEYMMQNASLYAMLQGSPPPFEKMLENDVWSTDEWKLKVAQMRKSVPTQYPQHGAYHFVDLQMANPFRTMWMEMALDGTSAKEATKSLVEVVDEILYFVCTEDNFEFANCRQCETDDYGYNISSCNPSNQSHWVVFFPSPSEEDGDCFTGEDEVREDSVKCDHVEYQSGFGVAIITASCLGALLALVSAVLVFLYRHRPCIKFSQPNFCVLFSLGTAGLCLSNLALVGPNTTISCVGRFAFPGIAFDLAFGALFSKVYRVRWVVSNVTSGRGRNKRKSFFPVVAVVSLALVMDLLVLAAWGVWGDYGPVEKIEPVKKYEVKMSECASDVSSFAIVFFALKIALIAWGVYLAWVTRKINYTLVEGREMSWSIYLFSSLIAFLVLVAFADLKVEYCALARTFVFCLSSCTALVMVLVPKLWAAHRGKDVDMLMLTSSATSTSRVAVEPWGGSGGRGGGSGSGSGGSDVDPWAVVCTHCNKLTASVFVADACVRLATGKTKRAAGPGVADPSPPLMVVDRACSAFAAGEPTPHIHPPDKRNAATPHSVCHSYSASLSVGDPRQYGGGVIGTMSGIVTQENLSSVDSSPLSLVESPLASRRDNPPQAAVPSKAARSRALAEKCRLAELPESVLTSASRGIVDGATMRSPTIFGGVGSLRARRSVVGSEDFQRGDGEVADKTNCGSSRKESSRGSWRLASDLSSASGCSEINAASFRRSLLTQAAALRAALWGTNDSSVQESQAAVGWSSAGTSSGPESRESRESHETRKGRGSVEAASLVEAPPPSRHGLQYSPGNDSGRCSSGDGEPSATSATSDPTSTSSLGAGGGGQSSRPRRLSLSPPEIGTVVG